MSQFTKFDYMTFDKILYRTVQFVNPLHQFLWQTPTEIIYIYINTLYLAHRDSRMLLMLKKFTKHKCLQNKMLALNNSAKPQKKLNLYLGTFSSCVCCNKFTFLNEALGGFPTLPVRTEPDLHHSLFTSYK